MFPKYREIQEPLLAELSRRGGRARPGDKDDSHRSIYEVLADHFSLPQEDRAAEIYEASGTARSKWENMVRWARNDLRKRDLIDASQWGVWALSSRGQSFLAERQSERAGRGLLASGIEISPDRLRELQKLAQEIGDLGEAIVLEHERATLKQAGRSDLASAVVHVARVNAAAGFDVLSFAIEGEEKYIEVKATVTDSETFEITANEWATAESRGARYWIYHVRNARADNPSIDKLQDPTSLVRAGRLLLRPTAFQVIPSEVSEADAVIGPVGCEISP